MSDKKSLENKKESAVDFAHETTKFLASFVPIVGYLHSLVIKSPSERRLINAIEKLGNDLETLQQNHSQLNLEVLANNPLFITAASNALLISIREHREEKLLALRNIVLNSALPNDIDEDIQLMFIQMIDSFTTWHIYLMRFFANPLWWQELEYKSGLEKLNEDDVVDKLAAKFTEFKDVSFLRKLITDLSNNQLLILRQMSGIKVSYLLLEQSDDLILDTDLVTELGKKFIKSINSPLA